jgi:hypothetical protein
VTISINVKPFSLLKALSFLLLSFPRRRESSAAGQMLDSRLRGNDGLHML